MLQIDVGGRCAHQGMHVPFADLFEEGCGAVVFGERLLPLLLALQGSRAVADGDTLPLEVTGFEEYLLRAFHGLQCLAGIACLQERHAFIILHLGCIELVARGCIRLGSL